MTQVEDRLRTLMASDVMARRVVELSADDSLEAAAESFITHGLSSAPVVDDKGICIGILSAADFLKSNRRDDVVNATSPDRNVRTLMTSAVQSVAPSTPLLRVAQIMSVGHIHRLPVIANERLVGVVSTLDIVSALVNAVDEWDAR